MDPATEARRAAIRKELEQARKNFTKALLDLESSTVLRTDSVVLRKRRVVQQAELCMTLCNKLILDHGTVHDRRRWAWWYNISQMFGGKDVTVIVVPVEEINPKQGD